MIPDPNAANYNTNLGSWQKRVAGFLLITFILAPAVLIVGLWPDRLPASNEFVKPLYHKKLFHVRLAGIYDSTQAAISLSSLAFRIPSATDTLIVKASPDSIRSRLNQTSANSCCPSNPNLLHFNTLILLLVCLAGFLGNMVHVTTSFSTYVGAEKFKKSWLLWYFVKPFTAAALALIIYFVFRGGYLNMNDDHANINLYGIMTISTLAGLFTDKATEKLKEIFAVIFKSTDNRPDKLGELKLTSIIPNTIVIGKENQWVITGENIDKNNLIITINETVIPDSDITASLTSLTIKYLVPETEKDKTEFVLKVADKTSPKIILIQKLALEQSAMAQQKLDTTITPNTIKMDGENKWVITGENIDKTGLRITINELQIPETDITATPTLLTIIYTVPETEKTKGDFTMNIMDKNNAVIFTQELIPT